MSSIYSGQLMRTFVKDNQLRTLENYNVNRYNVRITTAAAQSQREKELREGLEYQQAVMADLQTKLNEMIEKLNNIYRRYIDNTVAFRKVAQEPRYMGTSAILDGLGDITTPSGLPNDYPTGAPNNLLPFDDPGRIRNYSYNPFFGSKAIDTSDKTLLRTLWREPGVPQEQAYTENGAFWSSIAYLWGWDLDRINATYSTTTGLDNRQVNVTALQPNKTQYPPLRPGDRFPLNWNQDPTDPSTAGYPFVNINGLRPGGVDYSHATDSLNTGGDAVSSAHTNVVGQNSNNWGWEFDDLPLSLEVVAVSQQPDGNTVPTEYRVVYDIPVTHPFYEDLKVLNGTEPQITDAPTELRKERINNAGFNFTGTAYFPGSNVVGFQVGPLFRTSRGAWVVAQPGESEYSAPGTYTVADGPIAAFELQTCLPGLEINEDTRVSFKYRYRVHQNSAVFGSTWDDSGPGVPTRFDFSTHDWNSAGNEDFGSGNTFGVPMPGGYQILTNQPGDTLLELGQAPSPNSYSTDYNKTSGYETLYAKVVPGSTTDSVRVEFYFDGDLNNLEIEVEDFQIVDYTGDLNTWSQGKYNFGNVDPVIMEGDVVYTQANSPNEVISKYYPNVYQFTQFNDQYNNSWNAADRNDIVRSPWEFALLNIAQGSGLSGEMWLDLNGRRLNLDHDELATQMRDWQGNWITPSSTGFDLLSGGVTQAYAFIPVFHPEDDCGPNPTMEILATNTGTGFEFNPDAPTGGITVDSVAGFFAGQQVLVNGQLRTIVALVNDAGSPAGTTVDPVFENPAAPPIYEYRAPFDALPPAQRLATALPPPGGFPFTTGGVTYTNYADLAADFPPPAWHPYASDPSNPLYWAEYTQSSTPSVPARQEVYLNSPVTPPPTSGTIVPVVIVPEPPRVGQFSDSDPVTDPSTWTILLHDEVLAGELPIMPGVLVPFPPGNPTIEAPLDPGRTSNPTPGDPNNEGFNWSNPNFYDIFGNASTNPVSSTDNPTNFITGVSNDTSDTVDRVMGADQNISYRISIPTYDVNVLRKENNLLFNFGSIDERDWGIEILNPYMEFRTAPSYQTVPRYRVDAGGNIYDSFGKGYYDLDHPDAAVRARELASAQRVYTISGDPIPSGDPIINGQVSNANGTYDYSGYTGYDDGVGSFADFIASNDRLSLDSDDYNLFDYVPDLNFVPGDTERSRYGEVYVGSLPTNFYYYREALDNSASGSGTPLTAGGFNNDNKPTLNFNANASNRTGVYNDADTTVVYNPLMPTWTNVTLGVAEQNSRLSNQQRTTSVATWDGFLGLGGETSPARGVTLQNNVSSPLAALGQPDTNGALLNAPSASIVLNMQQNVNAGGHLLLYEAINGQSLPHAIPLPLVNIGVYPYVDSEASSYSFSAYGPETVTRTGSRYVSQLGPQILDGLDGRFDGNWTGADATARLQSAGMTVSTTHPPATWGEGLILHVDNAATFDVEAPRNEVYLGTDETTLYRVVGKNPSTSPQTLIIVPVSGSVPAALQTGVHADLQVRQIVGEYTVSVTNASGALDADGSHVRVDYNARGTQQPGRLDAVVISPEYDRVGRVAGDDPRTTAVETNRIGPEIFDSPQGYVQSDARVNLNLVSRDIDGNPVVRKLRSVRVDVESGEQLIPNQISQSYTTTGPFDINGEWPIAIFEGEKQLNPTLTNDLGIMVGLSQGIVNGSAATDAANPRLELTSTAGFQVGDRINVNGEERLIAEIDGNELVLNQALLTPPRLGDLASLGSINGEREVALFLNKSYAMSDGAPLKITLEYDEYQLTGYPPTADLTTPVRTTSETLGFSDRNPAAGMQILAGNTGTGTAANPIIVTSTAGFLPNDRINIHGQTYVIQNIIGTNGIETDRPIVPAPSVGEITRTDYENHLVVGNGSSGGSYDNEFTNELKRIIDNPAYQQLFRYGLAQNIFITASVTDPFNDLIASKLFLNWDRRQHQMELKQTAFSAYFKATPAS
ncbi:MAG: hypothetical protein ACO1RX_01760 [Candidatus Sericytochromatia bacterium]